MTATTTLSILDFSALMSNLQDNSPIAEILRKLSEQHEAVIAAVTDPPATPQSCWGGWH
jgi:hypothetical protein